MDLPRIRHGKPLKGGFEDFWSVEGAGQLANRFPLLKGTTPLMLN